tara:strand:- start:262 stop:534 length:273 start_codon:yes stop_codon:yes gene_type:complete
MQVVQKPRFKKIVKKLHKNEKADLKKAIQAVMDDPDCGQAKKGDLLDVRIYKFKMVKQEMLFAYHYEDNTITLTLLGLGSHENFYRDLKR